MLPWKTMFHSQDSPRLLVYDIELYLEENGIGFITVAICGGYISKYPRLQMSGQGSQPGHHVRGRRQDGYGEKAS